MGATRSIDMVSSIPGTWMERRRGHGGWIRRMALHYRLAFQVCYSIFTGIKTWNKKEIFESICTSIYFAGYISNNENGNIISNHIWLKTDRSINQI